MFSEHRWFLFSSFYIQHYIDSKKNLLQEVIGGQLLSMARVKWGSAIAGEIIDMRDTVSKVDITEVQIQTGWRMQNRKSSGVKKGQVLGAEFFWFVLELIYSLFVCKKRPAFYKHRWQLIGGEGSSKSWVI